jgi:hypothetical protein
MPGGYGGPAEPSGVMSRSVLRRGPASASDCLHGKGCPCPLLPPDLVRDFHPTIKGCLAGPVAIRDRWRLAFVVPGLPAPVLYLAPLLREVCFEMLAPFD